ncbi:MAG: hypothetical protein Q7S32_02395 [bacterium]|nr:hypothetical protein [bacterium]
MHRTVRILLAVLAGAFIGGTIALEVNRMFWWVGVLIGGSIAYLVYDLKEIALAIPRAWRRTTSWQPDREWWKALRNYTLGEFNLVAIICIGFALISFPIFALTGNWKAHIALLLATFLAGCFISCGMVLGSSSYDTRGIIILTSAQGAPNFLYLYLVLLPEYSALGIKWLLLKGIPLGAKFFKYLFLIIHSEFRLLCAVDAAIGVVIGFLGGSALIGAVVGGLFAVLNYEILSVRVFKIQGADSLFG